MSPRCFLTPANLRAGGSECQFARVDAYHTAMLRPLMALTLTIACTAQPSPAVQCEECKQCEECPERPTKLVKSGAISPSTVTTSAIVQATTGPTREFEIREGRAYLGGQPVELWGIRWGNALATQAITERHIRNLDNLAAHGINLVGVYIQGSNGGWPDSAAGRNGYTEEGALRPEFAGRLAWLVREADARGMVVMVGLFSPRKDQELRDEAAIERAIVETATFLRDQHLRNVFVDIMHEYNHRRVDHDLFREPDGAEKKAKLSGWFDAVAPGIEVGICPTEDSGTEDTYPGMDVRVIQKEMNIPGEGFVVNVEMQRHDPYDNEGKYEADEFEIMRAYFRDYRAADNAVLLFHSAFTQGITGKSGSGPHPEMGGYGRSDADRGVRFYFDWVQQEVGRWQYPRHLGGRGWSAVESAP